MKRPIPIAVWRDDPPIRGGDGISFTSNPYAQLFTVLVPCQTEPPMRATIRATSQRQALDFARFNHPNAIAERITVIGKPSQSDRTA